MKIFISHSSLDKWAARRISSELNALGVETFLDEKDIETGASIDDEIHKHLKTCDELLLLLSPASLKSHWVLIEVGGAKALEKRLIPILLYIPANEIPTPLSKHLARDINQIETYYQELQARISGSTLVTPQIITNAKKPVSRLKSSSEFRVGDKIEITRLNPPRHRVEEIGWDDNMGDFCGDTAIVKAIDDDRTVQLDIDGGKYWWAFEWIRKVNA